MRTSSNIGAGKDREIKPPGGIAETTGTRPFRTRKMRERRTAYVMTAFGLLLGGLELFILLHYI